MRERKKGMERVGGEGKGCGVLVKERMLRAALGGEAGSQGK